MLEAPGRLDDLRRELDEYFEGRLHRFTIKIDWALTHGFPRKVLQATARIPYGEVRTYRDVAGSAGNPRAVRAAGNGLGSNPMPVVVPCHRVVRTGGALGGYTGGVERKQVLLGIERRPAERPSRSARGPSRPRARREVRRGCPRPIRSNRSRRAAHRRSRWWR